MIDSSMAVSSPWEALKAGEYVYYWFRTKGLSKRAGALRLGYRGVCKVKVGAVGEKLIALSDGSVFERATGKASGKQELLNATHIIIPKKIIKPGRVAW